MSFGAHSEVGRLRRVMVHRPGLEHTRLTPSNAGELLFADVLWVARAKAEHDIFCEVMHEASTKPWTSGPAVSSSSPRIRSTAH